MLLLEMHGCVHVHSTDGCLWRTTAAVCQFQHRVRDTKKKMKKTLNITHVYVLVVRVSPWSVSERCLDLPVHDTLVKLHVSGCLALGAHLEGRGASGGGARPHVGHDRGPHEGVDAGHGGQQSDCRSSLHDVLLVYVRRTEKRNKPKQHTQQYNTTDTRYKRRRRAQQERTAGRENQQQRQQQQQEKSTSSVNGNVERKELRPYSCWSADNSSNNRRTGSKKKRDRAHLGQPEPDSMRQHTGHGTHRKAIVDASLDPSSILSCFFNSSNAPSLSGDETLGYVCVAPRRRWLAVHRE